MGGFLSARRAELARGDDWLELWKVMREWLGVVHDAVVGGFFLKVWLNSLC